MMENKKQDKKVFKKLAKQEIKKMELKKNPPKRDYLDDFPEKPKVLFLCEGENCDEKATTSFIDFLGNELLLCEGCIERKLREYKFNEEKFRKAYDENMRIKLQEYQNKLQEYKMSQLIFMNQNGK